MNPALALFKYREFKYRSNMNPALGLFKYREFKYRSYMNPSLGIYKYREFKKRSHMNPTLGIYKYRKCKNMKPSIYKCNSFLYLKLSYLDSCDKNHSPWYQDIQ